MLRLDIPRLERKGRIPFRDALGANNPLWEGCGLKFGGSLEVLGEASLAGAGQVVVRGELKGVLIRECRRCTGPVEIPLGGISGSLELNLVYAPTDQLGEEEDGEIRPIPPGAAELDLREAIREEVLLSLDAFVDCPEQGEGLCPAGSKYLDYELDGGPEKEVDPRWDALRALKERD